MEQNQGEKRRAQKRESANAIYRKGQEIGPPPAPPEGDNLKLREGSDGSLLRHLEICYPEALRLEWSPDHLRLIGKIDRAATDGGLSALAMPRGSGKTTIIIRAAIWAILTGRRRFVCLIGATEDAANRLLKGIKTELQFNQQLASLYPRETFCLRALEGESRRANGQRSEGEQTGVEWLSNRISFGNLPNVSTSGATLSTCGLTGNIRGQQETTHDGEPIRPDLVLIDDPQTKESARSRAQCEERHSIMMGDVLGMAGPDIRIAGLCTCTVIYQEDLADRLLDRTLSPDWQGERCKMVYKWPKNEEKWDEYRTIREAELREDGDGSKSVKFVEDNFDVLHEGSEVGWEARKNSSELSALHHAYNLRFRDEATFFAEYQNEPLTSATEIPFDLKVDEIASRTVPFKRNEVPDECEKITAFVDVQKEMLFYCVTAWTPDGRGHVIDYGTFPDQNRLHFSKRDIRNTLSETSGASDLNEALYFGLESLTGYLLEKTYNRGDGSEMQINRLGVDARWGYSTRAVRRFCRESDNSGRLHPMLGQYIGANSKPWHKWLRQSNERDGIHCRIQPPPKGDRGVREILVDVNWWKSFVADRLLTNRGANKSIVLYAAKPHEHRMFAEHCCAEEPVLVESKIGQKVVEWRHTNASADNDFWDCLVGTCVLASVEGVKVQTDHRKQKPPKKNSVKKKLVAILYSGLMVARSLLLLGEKWLKQLGKRSRRP